MKYALQSSTAAAGMHRVLALLHLYLVAVELYEVYNLIGGLQ